MPFIEEGKTMDMTMQKPVLEKGSLGALKPCVKLSMF